MNKKYYVDEYGNLSYYVTYSDEKYVAETDEEFYTETSADSDFRNFDFEKMENTRFSTRKVNTN